MNSLNRSIFVAIAAACCLSAVNYNNAQPQYMPARQPIPQAQPVPQGYPVQQGYNNQMMQQQMQTPDQQQQMVPQNIFKGQPDVPSEINERPDNSTIYTPEFSRQVQAAEKYRLSQTVIIDWDALERIEPNASIFVEKAKKADFKCLFPKNGTYTIFIPTNEVFNSFTKEMQDSVFNDQKKLCMFLSYHIVYGKVTPSKIFTSFTKTVNGNKLKLKYNGKDLMVNDAKVLKTDVLSPTNISIHLIDKALIP